MYNDAIMIRMAKATNYYLFLESYTRRTTHNGILKNCTVANIAIKAFLRV